MIRSAHIRKRGLKIGDRVRVISGQYKSHVGEILRCTCQGVVVKGANQKFRFIKKFSPEDKRWKPVRIYRESPLHASKVMLCDDQGPGKVTFVLENGVRRRVVRHKKKE